MKIVEGFKKNMYRFLYMAGPYERSLTESLNNAHFSIVPPTAPRTRGMAPVQPEAFLCR